MYRLFERFFKIRPAECALVMAFLLYYICIGMFYTVGAVVGDSLFLTNVDPEVVEFLLSWVYVGIVIATVVVTSIYDSLQHRFSRINLLVGTQLVLLLSVPAF